MNQINKNGLLLLLLTGLSIISCRQSQKTPSTEDSTASQAVTSKRDTVYFDLRTQMIDSARVQKLKLKNKTRYRVFVQLKDAYKKEYEQATSKAIGNYFAIRYHGKILLPGLPVIHTKIRSGQFTIEPFKKKKEAIKIKKCILDVVEE
jgi:preprotein translocase subunit SecD